MFFLIIIFILLHTGPIENYVRNYAVNLLKKNYNLKVVIKDLDYNLLNLGLDLRGVIVQDVNKQEFPVFFQADRVKAKLTTALLFRGEIKLKELSLSNLQLHLYESRVGVSNIPDFNGGGKKQEDQTSGEVLPPFQVGKINFTKASIIWENRAEEIYIRSPVLNLLMERKKASEHLFEIESRDKGKLVFNQKKFLLQSFSMSGILGQDFVKIQDFVIQSDNSIFEFAGMVGGFQDPELDLNLNAEIDVNSFSHFISDMKEISGKINTQAKIQGPFSSLQADMSFQGQNITWEQLSNIKFKGEARWNKRQLSISTLEIYPEGGEVTGSGVFHPLNWAEGNQAKFQWEGLELSSLSFLMDGFPALSSKVSGSFELEWDRLNLDAFKGEVALNFNRPGSVTQETKEVPKLWGSVHVDLNQQNISLQITEFMTENERLTGGVVYKDHSLSGSYIFEVEDLYTFGERYFPNLMHEYVPQLSGDVSVSGRIQGRLSDPEIIFFWEGKNISFFGLSGMDLKSEASLSGGNLDIQNFLLNAEEFKAKLSGLYSFDQPQATSIDFNITDISLKNITSFIGIENQLKGDISLEGQLMGISPHPAIKGKAVLTGFQYSPAEIDEAVLDFNIEENKLNLEITIPSPSILIKGDLNLVPPFDFTAVMETEDSSVSEILSVFTSIPSMKTPGETEIRMEFTGEVETLNQTDISGSVKIKDTALNLKQPDVVFEEINLDLVLDQRSIEIQPSSLKLDNGQIGIAGRFPLSLFTQSSVSRTDQGKKSGWINMEFSGLDPFVLGSVFAKNFPAGATGNVSGNINVTFNSFDWDSIRAEASLDTVNLMVWGMPVELESPTLLSVRSGTLLVEDIQLKGHESSVNIKGSIDLIPNQDISIDLDGDMDLKLVQPFLEPAAISGKSRYQVRIQGSAGDPKITGSMDLQDVQFEFSDPFIYVSDLSGELNYKGNQISIDKMEGSFNGGQITLDGMLTHKDLGIELVDLNFSGKGINLNYPEGLRSLINADLSLVIEEDQPVLNGQILLLSAEYKDTFNVRSQLFRLIKSRGRSYSIIQRNKFLNDLDFDLQISTENPVRIDNNLINAQAEANLTLAGSPYNPGLSGRMEILEGGKVFFAKNTYEIEQASIDFINPNQIVPEINLRGQTKVSGYLIVLIISGAPDNLSATLTSDPFLPETDIISLLLTGRRLEYVSSSLLNVISTQALDYVEKAVFGKAEQIVEQTFGLDNVRLDTSLIAPHENPETRITIGQNITPNLDMIISQGLRQTDERTIILSYFPIENLDLRAVKRDDDTYQFDALHRVRFGLKKKEQSGTFGSVLKRLTIERIEIQGDTSLSRDKILEKLKLKPGWKVDFFSLQNDLDRIKKLYRNNNYLEAEIDVQKQEEDDTVIITYSISSGPKVFLNFGGLKISSQAREEAKMLWMQGVFQKNRFEDIRRLLKKVFYKQGYYRLSVDFKQELVDPGTKVIHINISPGMKFDNIHYEFPGLQGISKDTILSRLDQPDFLISLFNDPDVVINGMKSVYRSKGYLNVNIHSPQIEFLPEKKIAAVTIKIKEGKKFIIDTINFAGRLSIDQESLLSAAGISENYTFTPEVLYQIPSNLEDFYSSHGFINAHIESHLKINYKEGTVEITFVIQENEKAVIQEIVISGNKITEKSVIERELSFHTGEAVDFFKFSQTQKTLYGLGIFNAVSIDYSPLNQEIIEMPGSAHIKPFVVHVRVEEFQPYFLRYGAQYDTETGFGGIAELDRRNLFGRAIEAGLSIKANMREQDARIFLQTPYFLGARIDTNLFGFATRKEEPDFTTRRLGSTLQQQKVIHDEFVITYNYTFENLRNLAGKIPLPETRYNIGRVSFSLSRDSRENIFNSLKGSFISLTGEYAEKFMASDVRYVRFFGQYFIYRLIGDSLTYAAGLRVGLGRGLGEDLVPSERFFAGGSSSLRGFDYHEVGPKNPHTGNPQGGNAVFILNQELRFPIYKIFSGVVFLDTGNVYPLISDFDPLNVRETAGFGFRLDLGFVLARMDLGFKLDRLAGEPLYHIHFSLGQAF